MEKVDITTSKNQALQILYLVYSVYIMIQYYSVKQKHTSTEPGL